MYFCFIYLLFRTKQVLPLLLDIYSETLLDRSFQTFWKFVDGSSAKFLHIKFNVFMQGDETDNESRARLLSYGFDCNAISPIKHYPVDSVVYFVNTYPQD